MELHPVSVHRPGSRAIAGAHSASASATVAAPIRTALMRSAYDEEVARGDLLVEVVHHGELPAVAPLLQAPQREAVRAGREPPLLHGAPRGSGEPVGDRGRLVQQEAD